MAMNCFRCQATVWTGAVSRESSSRFDLNTAERILVPYCSIVINDEYVVIPSAYLEQHDLEVVAGKTADEYLIVGSPISS